MTDQWKYFKFNPHKINISFHNEITFNSFDLLLRAEWDRALSQNLFTYEIDEKIKQRMLDGDLRYIIELNPSRFEKRRMPYPFEHVNTLFDKEKFNFNKIKDEEILFALDTDDQINRNLVVINNSPIRPYHVLLVPDRHHEQPQIVTVDCLLFGFNFIASSAHPFIYVGFNSLCGMASINHLHLHGLYMSDRLFLQTIECKPFHHKSNCYLFDLFDLEAFAFEIKHVDDFHEVAQFICRITNYLTSSNIAHNFSIMKGVSFSSSNSSVIRVFIWFRQSNIGAKLCNRCNFACLELSGYMFLRYEDVFENLTEAELRQRMNEIALPFDKQTKIKEDIMNLLDQ